MFKRLIQQNGSYVSPRQCNKKHGNTPKEPLASHYEIRGNCSMKIIRLQEVSNPDSERPQDWTPSALSSEQLKPSKWGSHHVISSHNVFF